MKLVRRRDNVCVSEWERGRKGSTCAINMTNVSIPHQEWSEYIWGMLRALWFCHTATIPETQHHIYISHELCVNANMHRKTSLMPYFCRVEDQRKTVILPTMLMMSTKRCSTAWRIFTLRFVSFRNTRYTIMADNRHRNEAKNTDKVDNIWQMNMLWKHSTEQVFYYVICIIKKNILFTSFTTTLTNRQTDTQLHRSIKLSSFVTMDTMKQRQRLV